MPGAGSAGICSGASRLEVVMSRLAKDHSIYLLFQEYMALQLLQALYWEVSSQIHQTLTWRLLLEKPARVCSNTLPRTLALTLVI